MAEPYADMECCLKVHASCASSMMKTHDAIRSIRGVYSVEWDAQENVFRISGEVNPTVLLKVVSRTGDHAEVINFKVKHPLLRYRNYNYRSYGPTFGNHMPPPLPYRDAYRSSLPSLPYYGTNDHYYPYGMPRGPARIDYVPSYNTTYDHQNPLPPATYVPSLPYQEYNDPYHNYAGVDPCSIM